MPISNCKHCGRIFNRVRSELCPACLEEENQNFLALRTYLRDNPNATISDASEATGVGVESIVSLIQDGRLILRDNPNFSYPCQRCGEPTQTGRYCAACSKELVSNLQKASEQIASRKPAQSNGDHKGYYSSRDSKD